MWMAIVMAGSMALLIFLLVQTIKRQREAFSGKRLAESFSVLACLALGLIAFIALCVLLLNNH